MNERVVPGPVQDSCGIREAVCIHTKKIYDSCREEDIASYRKKKIPLVNRVLRKTPRRNRLVWFSLPWCRSHGQ